MLLSKKFSLRQGRDNLGIGLRKVIKNSQLWAPISLQKITRLVNFDRVSIRFLVHILFLIFGVTLTSQAISVNSFNLSHFDRQQMNNQSRLKITNGYLFHTSCSG